MNTHLRAFAACAALLALATAAQAQPRVTTKADPLDPAASVPTAGYASPLARYQRYAEQPVGTWQALNQTVNSIGGWRVYAREASAPDAPKAVASGASTPAGAASAPAAKTPAGHAGHKTN